jgi:hypothetical protein
MKISISKNRILFLLIAFVVSLCISAQQTQITVENIIALQTQPNVEKLAVEYLPALQSFSIGSNGRPDIKVFPHVTVTLKTTENISKVYL